MVASTSHLREALAACFLRGAGSFVCHVCRARTHSNVAPAFAQARWRWPGAGGRRRVRVARPEAPVSGDVEVASLGVWVRGARLDLFPLRKTELALSME